MRVTKPLIMPKMGESIKEGTIINWLVEEGEIFKEGDILLEVATDKVDNEIPAPFAGKLLERFKNAKAVVPVGESIALLEKLDVSAETKKPEKEHKQEPEKKSEQTTKHVSNTLSKSKLNIPESFTPNTNLFISPLVDSIARKHHISYQELARIPSTGIEGRLRKSDVITYIANGRPHKFVQPLAKPTNSVPDLKFDLGDGKRVKMDRMRQMIADHMVYSKHTSPHVTAYVDVDVTNLVAWRNLNKTIFQDKHNQKLTFTPLFIEAVAKAITDFPNINASVDGDSILLKQDINIGMATALPSGNLIVPVVKKADLQSLSDLATTVNNLASKARHNKLTSDDIKGGTFTISNVGTFGSLMGTPIINQPEVAILAFGSIKKRAEVIETKQGDEIAIRSMMYLSLSFDHRVVDGFLGGSFLKRVADYLEDFDMSRDVSS